MRRLECRIHLWILQRKYIRHYTQSPENDCHPRQDRCERPAGPAESLSGWRMPSSSIDCHRWHLQIWILRTAQGRRYSESRCVQILLRIFLHVLHPIENPRNGGSNSVRTCGMWAYGKIPFILSLTASRISIVLCCAYPPYSTMRVLCPVIANFYFLNTTSPKLIASASLTKFPATRPLLTQLTVVISMSISTTPTATNFMTSTSIWRILKAGISYRESNMTSVITPICLLEHAEPWSRRKHLTRAPSLLWVPFRPTVMLYRQNTHIATITTSSRTSLSQLQCHTTRMIVKFR